MADIRCDPEGNTAMADDVQRPEGRRSAARRALLGAASPLVGYFDRRFQELHEHIDDQPALDRLAEQVRHELSQTRTDVAADTDTIAELAFTLERFADLFTARMEELAGHFTAAASRAGGTDYDSSIVELPFAFAAAAGLERGANVAAIGDDGRLAVGLSALGLRVTAVDPIAGIAHPDVAIVDEPVSDWVGPSEPFDAVFVLSPMSGRANARAAAQATIARVHKWLRPTGLLVVAVLLDADEAAAGDQLDQLLADWDVERDAYFEHDSGGAWRRVDEVPEAGLALVRAAPRA
jgi:hypothetical protein